MSKAPSAETQLRTARKDLKGACRKNMELAGEINKLRLALAEARGKETKALQEIAEWRKRFDDLLARVPVTSLEPSK